MKRVSKLPLRIQALGCSELNDFRFSLRKIGLFCESEKAADYLLPCYLSSFLT